MELKRTWKIGVICAFVEGWGEEQGTMATIFRSLTHSAMS